MKATFDRNDLLDSVLIVQRAMPARTPMEILDGIHMRMAHSDITLRCTDTVLSIEDTFPAMVEETGEIVLPGRLFSEIVRKLPQGSVSIEVDDEQIKIACGSANMMLQGINADSFPPLPTMEDVQPLTIKQNELRNLIHQTNFATAQDETQPILTGELLELNNKDAVMVALDGYRMAIATHPIEGNKIQTKAVLPGKALSEIAKLFDESEQEANIFFGQSMVAVQMGQTRILTRLLEGEFINYKQILPTSRQTRVQINTLMFADAVERASLLAREGRNNLIKLNISEHILVISANGDRGNTTEEVELSNMEGKALTIAFNAKYLLDILHVVRDEYIYLDFISDRSPCVIKPVQGDAYLYIVLPVRVQS